MHRNSHPRSAEASDEPELPELLFEELDGLLGYRLRRAQGAMHRDYMAAVAGLNLTQKLNATLWLINANPGVVECAVTAVPDEVISNRIVAYVAAKPHLDNDKLAAWCATLIPKYMVPESFVFADLLPKTSTGKIDRQALQKTG